ncbi:MAG: response regulator [Bacteroidales bacterium]|nr:response regulator [Bacteroidales bacterium]
MASRPKILIVDDERVGRLLLEATLDSDEYDMLLAENGNQALALAKEHNPDLILLDVMMPGQDGFEICEKIKSEERLKDIPVLLVTALEDKDSRVRGFKAGADDYIPKPFNRIELLSRVKTFTGLYKYKKMQKLNGEESEVLSSASIDIKDEAESQIHSFFFHSIKESFEISDDKAHQFFSDYFTLIHLQEGAPHPYTAYFRKEDIWMMFMHSDSTDPGASILNILGMVYFQRLLCEMENARPEDILYKLYNYLFNLAETSDLAHLLINMNLAILRVERGNRILNYSSLNMPVFINNNNNTILFSAEKLTHPNLNIDGPVATVKDFKMSANDSLFLIPNNIMMEFDERSFEQLFISGQKLSFVEQKEILKKSIEQILKNLGNLYFVAGFQLK